jgi:hypothetical protein
MEPTRYWSRRCSGNIDWPVLRPSTGVGHVGSEPVGTGVSPQNLFERVVVYLVLESADSVVYRR